MGLLSDEKRQRRALLAAVRWQGLLVLLLSCAGYMSLGLMCREDVNERVHKQENALILGLLEPSSCLWACGVGLWCGCQCGCQCLCLFVGVCEYFGERGGEGER